MQQSWDTGYMPSYIIGCNGPYYFACVIPKGLSAIIYREKAVSHSLRVGDFLMCKIKRNPTAKPTFRAQHVVEDFKLMNPIDRYRIERDQRDNEFVIITTIATVSGSTDYNRKSISILKNSKFGTFVDIDSIIPRNTRDGVEIEFEFKCKISPIDMYASIFVPIKVIRYFNGEQTSQPPPPPRPISPHFGRRPSPEEDPRRTRRLVRSRSKSVGAPKRCIGFVGYDNDSFYWVWCKDFDHDVKMFKPHGIQENMIGTWVSMLVEQESRSRAKTCEPVKVIDNFHPSRVQNGVPEIEVTCEYNGEMDDAYPAFYSDVVGSVVDVDLIAQEKEEGAKYRVWIVRHKWDSTVSRWKISSKQKLAYPLGEDGEPKKPTKAVSRLSRSRPGSARRMPEASTFSAAAGNGFHNYRSRDSSDENETDDDTNIYSEDEEERIRKMRIKKDLEEAERRKDVEEKSDFDDDDSEPNTPTPTSTSSQSLVSATRTNQRFKGHVSPTRSQPSLFERNPFERLKIYNDERNSETSTQLPPTVNREAAPTTPGSSDENVARSLSLMKLFLRSRNVREAMKSHNHDAYEELLDIVL